MLLEFAGGKEQPTRAGPHAFLLETVGDTMRASIDGKPVAFLQSLGIARATKSKVEFGCMGRDGFFDDLKIWNAEPAK